MSLGRVQARNHEGQDRRCDERQPVQMTNGAQLFDASPSQWVGKPKSPFKTSAFTQELSEPASALILFAVGVRSSLAATRLIILSLNLETHDGVKGL